MRPSAYLLLALAPFPNESTGEEWPGFGPDFNPGHY